MKSTAKRVCALLLALLLAAGPQAVSAEAASNTVERADSLASLRLFTGTNDGYQLDRVPSRIQGLVMLIRLLGKEDFALAMTEPSPFTDMTWGDQYAAYAYRNGLVTGTSDTTYAPNNELTALAYVTLLLRALGYSEKDGDFVWGQQMELAASLGLIHQDAAAELTSRTMDRGVLVDLSYAALTCQVKGGGQTLAQRLVSEGVFTQGEGEAAGVLGSGAGWTYPYGSAGASDDTPAVPAGSSAIRHTAQSIPTSGGAVSANVLTVDVSDPAVTVKTAMVQNTLGATAPFSEIVKSSGGAAAVVNGNYFESYSDFQVPIGHVMVDGTFLYGSSGISSLGITEDGEIRIGRPALFTRIQAAGGDSWTAYEINTAAQGPDASVLYTPAYGREARITESGYVMAVSGGVITSYRYENAGVTGTLHGPADMTVIRDIPSDGYLVYMGENFTATDYFRTPKVGDRVELEYYLQRPDPEGFTLDGLVSVVSGAPRLVENGAMATGLEPGFTEERFTVNSSPRTAVGVDAQGRLLLVSTPAATVQQMREAMLALGCVDAFCLDGGASCGMYYNGTYLATPGRQLTTTLQIFVGQ